MKILQINSVCGFGSTGRIVVDLYKMLEANGNECCIAFGRGSKPDGINTIKIGNKVDVYMHAIFSRVTDKHGFYSKLATNNFITKAKEFNPDIIHLHNIHGYYINIELLFYYLKESGKPVIWTLHDCWAFTGHCSHFDSIECNKWKEKCCYCPQKKQYPMSICKDNSLNNYIHKNILFRSLNKMTLVTPSEWLKQKVSESFMKGISCDIIYNGIDLAAFTFTKGDLRKKYNLDNKFVILGVANNWNQRKGLNIYIDLSKRLSSKYTIVLIGLTKKQIKALPKNILGIERTDSLQILAEWYSLANLYFNSSIEETMGLTTIEALACGTPAMVFNKTAIPELLTEQCGIVLPEVDSGTICDTIVQADWRKFTADDCRRQALKFDKQLKYKQYSDLYIEVGKENFGTTE